LDLPVPAISTYLSPPPAESSPLSLHDALPICIGASNAVADRGEFAVGVHNATDFLRPSTGARVDVEANALYQGRTQQLWEVIITDRKSTRLNSSHVSISYAVFCLKKKRKNNDI